MERNRKNVRIVRLFQTSFRIKIQNEIEKAEECKKRIEFKFQKLNKYSERNEKHPIFKQTKKPNPNKTKQKERFVNNSERGGVQRHPAPFYASEGNPWMR